MADLRFRRLGRNDFGDLERWLSAPHVRKWWGKPLDTPGIEREFGPCVDGVDPTMVFVTTVADRSIGIVQTYLLSDTPEYESAVGVEAAAGIDLFIGEPDLLGTGLGKSIVQRFVAEIGWTAFPQAQRYMAGPSIENVRSRRTFEAAGFVYIGQVDIPGEPDPEAVMVLERSSIAESSSEIG